MKRFDNILFDLDGTLTDPAEGITRGAQIALEHFGIRIPDKSTLTFLIGPPLREIFMSRYGFDAEQAELAMVKYREYYSVTGLFENTPYEGIREVLETLSASSRLFVATAKPTVFSERILERFGLKDYFVEVCGSELDGRNTDKADLIRALLQKHALDASRTVMVGDREFDVRGAKANALFSVGVTYGYGTRDELLRAGADRIVESVFELPDACRAENGSRRA